MGNKEIEMAIFVRLDPETAERLTRLAWAERRRPQDQAAIILRHALLSVEEEKQKENEKCQN
jgi:hypothetical protein